MLRMGRLRIHRNFRSTLLALLLTSITLVGCASDGRHGGAGSAHSPAVAAADVVSLTILQMNDVYEALPVAGGTHGGLARMATGRAERLRSNPNTIAVLAGDLFNPSAMGLARVGGARLYGRHMVDVMNALGLDDATFGNHEFELSQGDFRKRLAQSNARWFSSNTFDARGQPFPGVPEQVIFEARNPAGRSVRVGRSHYERQPARRRDVHGCHGRSPAASDRPAAPGRRADRRNPPPGP
jgi:2',3'-cyclic-nucleotide 2'-phosphodiesterase (5'-nucleotidase family)